MKQIKVLHLIKSLGRGGAEVLLLETLKMHDKEKYHFYYTYFIPWKDAMVNELKDAGGQVKCFPSKNNFSLILKFRYVEKFIKKNNIDIIHCHLPWSGFLGRLIHWRTGIPLIYTEHNSQDRYHYITRLINKLTYRCQNLVIAVSGDVADSVKKEIPKFDRLTIVNNGVDTDTFNPGYSVGNKKREFNIPPDAVVFGNISVFRKQKRLDIWVELASQIAARTENSFFVLVGDGPLQEKIVKKINEVRMGHRFILPGRITNVRDWLATFDIFMITSEFEGLPVAMLEAMAMSLPVLTTQAGGIGEVVRNEKEGFVVPVDNPFLLLDKAVDLAKDPGLRKLLGIQSRLRVKEKYSIRDMVSHVEKLYIDQV